MSILITGLSSLFTILERDLETLVTHCTAIPCTLLHDHRNDDLCFDNNKMSIRMIFLSSSSSFNVIVLSKTTGDKGIPSNRGDRVPQVYGKEF